MTKTFELSLPEVDLILLALQYFHSHAEECGAENQHRCNILIDAMQDAHGEILMKTRRLKAEGKIPSNHAIR